MYMASLLMSTPQQRGSVFGQGGLALRPLTVRTFSIPPPPTSWYAAYTRKHALLCKVPTCATPRLYNEV